MTYGDYKDREEEADDTNFAFSIYGCGSIIVWGGIIAAIIWAGGFWPMVQTLVLLTLGSLLVATGLAIKWFLKNSH